MEPHLAPILHVEPQRHHLMGRDTSTAAVAHLPAARREGKFNRAVMWETTILESESDQLPSHLRVHT
jgi:hypothetical protein